MSFAAFQEESRRLVILQCLSAAVQYRAALQLVLSYCDAMGHVVGHDRIQADLTWLRDSGLVMLANEGAVTVATLTSRGNDVATGRTTVPGVHRPQPGA